MSHFQIKINSDRDESVFLIIFCKQSEHYCSCSINPSTNQIDLSLRGPDVKDKDPAPPPTKRKRPRTESDRSEPETKRDRKDSTDLQIELLPDGKLDDVCSDVRFHLLYRCIVVCS